jgi:hypothetical protein
VAGVPRGSGIAARRGGQRGPPRRDALPATGESRRASCAKHVSNRSCVSLSPPK